LISKDLQKTPRRFRTGRFLFSSAREVPVLRAVHTRQFDRCVKGRRRRSSLTPIPTGPGDRIAAHRKQSSFHNSGAIHLCDVADEPIAPRPEMRRSASEFRQSASALADRMSTPITRTPQSAPRAARPPFRCNRADSAPLTRLRCINSGQRIYGTLLRGLRTNSETSRNAADIRQG